MRVRLWFTQFYEKVPAIERWPLYTALTVSYYADYNASQKYFKKLKRTFEDVIYYMRLACYKLQSHNWKIILTTTQPKGGITPSHYLETFHPSLAWSI